MLYHNVQVMGHLQRLTDAAAVAGATILALWLDAGDGGVSWSPVVFFTGAVVMFFLLVAERLHIYVARRTGSVAREVLSLWEGLIYAIGMACAAAEILGYGLPGQGYFKVLLASTAALLGLRVVMRFTVRRLRRQGDDYRVWLIVGRNGRAADLAETILGNPHFGIRIGDIVDFADSGASAQPLDARFSVGPLSGVKCVQIQDAGAIRDILAGRVIDEVVITLPVRSCYDRIRDIVQVCSEAGISVKLRPEVFDIPGFATEVTHVGSVPMVTHFNGPSNYRLLIAKRVIDVIGSAVGLVLISPLLIGLAIAVKLSSPGPVFFVQARVGLHGRRFNMIKFRSMVRDAQLLRNGLTDLNERDGTAFKIRHDARITGVGRWMRKYRLDELPQLWNVLIGDMSLVGPRPFPVSEAIGFEWWQRRRLTMPPGMTCLWQLADDPTMPIRQWMKLDMDYIDRWSLWLDLKLIARTFVTVARGRGW